MSLEPPHGATGLLVLAAACEGPIACWDAAGPFPCPKSVASVNTEQRENGNPRWALVPPPVFFDKGSEVFLFILKFLVFLRDCGSTATSFKEEDAGSQWFEIS